MKYVNEIHYDFDKSKMGNKIRKRMDELGIQDERTLYALMYPKQAEDVMKSDADLVEKQRIRDTVRYLSNWIKGKNAPKNIEDILLLCKALQCDANYLIMDNSCTTQEIQDIHEYTGLSEEAIENLNVANGFPIGEVMKINGIKRPSREDDKPSHAIDLILKNKTIFNLLVNFIQLEDYGKNINKEDTMIRASSVLVSIQSELYKLKENLLKENKEKEIKKIDEYDDFMRKARAKKKK